MNDFQAVTALGLLCLIASNTMPKSTPQMQMMKVLLLIAANIFLLAACVLSVRSLLYGNAD